MKNRKMNSLKRRLPAFLLAFSLLLNMPGTAAAEENPEEIITESSDHTAGTAEDPSLDPESSNMEEVLSEEPEETPETIPSETHEENPEAAPAETPAEQPEESGDEKTPVASEEELPEETPVGEETAEPKSSAFSDSVTVSGVTISVSADENVFPQGAVLHAEESDGESGASALSASEEHSSDEENEEEEPEYIVAASYSFDVRILDEAGNPVQPQEGSAAVLSFSMEEAQNPNLTARVICEGSDGPEELESCTEEGSVVLETSSFANYTIEFVYKRKTFPGTPGTVYKIKTILEFAGIVLKEDEKIDDVSLDSQGNSFAVLTTKDNEKCVELKSISASDMGHKEILSVRIGKITYEIKLTCTDSLWYIYRDERNTVGEGRELRNFRLVSDTKQKSFTNGWYVFQGNLKFNKDRVTIDGDQVSFVLMDGASVEFEYGLRIAGNSHLNIYGQANDSGKLIAESATSFLGISTSSRAAIGGNKNDTGGSITINGGIVEATGSDGGAGIGAAKNGTFGNIIINGGEVKAQGGGDAAGIGGGEYGGPISKIEINGGSVSATGGKRSGAGIGGGDESKDGGQIIINGGYVKAIGSGGNSKKGPIFWSYAAGIGGGKNRSGPDQIIIRGGKVEAYGGDYGAGIGGGDHASSGTILIYGGEVSAAGGIEGAAIGGGYYGGIGKNARVEIFGGSVSTSYFESSSRGAGIGGGNGFDYYNSNDQGGDVIIHDGFISIYANDGAGIGGGGNSGSGGNVTINGGQVMISSNSGAAIGGGGTKDVHGTDPKQGGGGKVTINGGEVCAISAKGGAAIGGGAGKDGGTLIINDGFVVAVTSPVTFDLINNIKYAKGTNANASFAISLARFVGKIAFANPQTKSPAAVGGGYFAGNADRGGDGGTLVMNGGTLIAKSGYKEVAAIGPGSGGKKNDAYTIPKNMMVLAGDDVTASNESLKPVLGSQRIEALKNKPVVAVMECFHEDAIYYSNEQGHIPQCRYCEETRIMYPHDWDESGLVCKTCGYKRTGEISAELADPKAEYVYTGEEIRPAVTVSCFGRLLTEGKDYSVFYAENIDAGTAEITVNGIGSYTGTKTLNFVIQKAQLLDLMLSRTLYPYSFHSWTTYNPETDCVIAESIVQPKPYDYYIMGQEYVDAGTWHVTAYAKNASNYQGTAATTITITPYSLEDCTVVMPDSRYVYDGLTKRPVPDVQVMYEDEKVWLHPDRDYTLSYENNKNAGTAKVIIQGCGNFTGRKEVPFTIEKAPVTELDIEDPVLSYTGREQTLKIRKVLADTGVIPMSACTITGNKGTEAGEYTVTVTVQNANYTGTISAPWSILPADASKFTASLKQDSFIYSGTAFTPDVTVKDGDKVLVPDRDYTLAYRDNILPGNAAAVITGMGSYAGTVTLPFRIEKARLVSAMLERDQLEYNGKTQTVAAAFVKDENGRDITKETESYTIRGASARDAGKYTAVISAASDSPYQGSIELQWTIEPKDASKLNAELIESSFVYDGEEKMPSVTVKDGDQELRPEEDFTVMYQNNTDAGEAKAKVLLKNGYEGLIELPFVIAKARIDTFELRSSELIYNGGTQTVLPAAVRAGELDVPEEEYLLTGNTAASAGEYQAKITARESGNFTGTLSAAWKISAKSVSRFDAELSNDTFVFDGSEKTPGVTVRDGSSVLTEGEEYTLSYQNNVTAGTAKVILTGIGSYQGTKELPFTILKAEIDTVDLFDDALIYNGETLTQKIAGVYADGLAVPEEAYEVSGDAGTDAGQYNLTVKAADGSNFTGEIDVPWSIIPVGAETFTAELVPQEFTYDGTEKHPAVTVRANEKVLEEETDYFLEYGENINAGTGRVTVYGTGNYKGTKVLSFHIEKARLTEAILDETELIYDGTWKNVNLKEVKAGTVFVPEEALTFTGGSGLEAGSYTAVISADDTGNFTGRLYRNWQILPMDISGFTAALSPNEYTYDGTEKKPSVTVKDGDTVLAEGTDFTVSYTANRDAGEAKALISGTGSCTGTITVPFTIRPAEITEVILKEDSLAYNGAVQTVGIEAIRAGALIVHEADVIVRGNSAEPAGSYELTVTAKENSNYSGSAGITWTIEPKDASGFDAALSEDRLVYDGSEKKPSVTVKDGSAVLAEGEDYSLRYENNIDAGEAKAVITGSGNYSGTRELPFVITPREIDTVDLSDSVLIYNGSEQSPEILNVYADGLDVPSSAYEVRGNTGTEAKDYELTVNAVTGGNYTGAVSAPWSIIPVEAKTFTLDISPGEFVYDGTEKIPSVTVRDGEKVLAEGSDYTLTISDNIHAGYGLVTVTGIGGYRGIRSVSFAIRKAELTSAELVRTAFVYDGSEKTAEIASVRAGDLTVTEDQYSLSGNTAVDADDYTLLVSAKDDGDFSGSVTADYVISQKSGEDLSVVLNPDTFTYDGRAKNPEVLIRNGNAVLIAGRDYSVSYRNNVNAGEAEAEIRYTGNYSGIKTVPFTISPAGIDAVELAEDSLPYTGERIRAVIRRVLSGSLELSEDDYTVTKDTGIASGDYVLKVTARENGNFTGTQEASWQIVPKPAAELAVSLIPDQFVYDTTEKKPAVTVRDGSKILQERIDYTLSYRDNTEAGSAAAMITGKGNYSGSKEALFTILPAAIDAAELKESALVYNRSEQTAEVVKVFADGLEVPEDAYEISGNTAADAGDYELRIQAVPGRNFAGSITVPWSIVQAEEKRFDAVLEQNEFTYDGSEQKPAVTVKDGTDILKEGEDYLLEYSDNVNAGTAKVIVSGIGNYRGSKVLVFRIAKAEIDGVLLESRSLLYTGTEQAPQIMKVTSGNLTVPEEAYSVSGNARVKAGAYVLTVSAKDDGNFTGSQNASWRIEPMSVRDLEAVLSETEFVYDGSEKTPSVIVRDGTDLLAEGIDYRLSWQDNTEAGEASVTIHGRGNYTDVKTLHFTIAKREIDGIDLLDSMLAYTGREQTAEILNVWADGLPVPSEAYTIRGNTGIEANDYELTVIAKPESSYTGSFTVPWSILPAGKDRFDAMLEETDFVYDSLAKTPGVRVTDGSKVLREDKDYTLAYTDNIDAGTAKVKITGRGNYQGSTVLSFVIRKAKLTEALLEDQTLTYNGKVQSAGIFGVYAGDMEVPEDAYYIENETGKEAGEYSLTVTAAKNGNFTGSVSVPFRIVPAGIETLTAGLSPTAFVYDGTPKQPEVTLKNDAGTKLVLGRDYTVSYEDNIEPGEAKAVILCQGSYTGTITLSFVIDKASITSASLRSDSLIYTGREQTAAVTEVRSGSLILNADEYTADCERGIEPGVYRVTLTAGEASRFTGTLLLEWTIEPKPEESLSVTLSPETFVYDGTEKQPSVTVRDGDTVLVRDRDYTVTYKDNVNAGTAEAGIVWTGNYTGEREVPFVIQKAPVTEVILADDTLLYNGSKQTVSALKVMANDLEVPLSSCAFSGNEGTEADTYAFTASFAAAGNFTGSAEAEWKILAAEIGQLTAVLSESSFVYDGSAKKPSVTVKDGSNVLAEGRDYSLRYENNIDAGEAKAVITGCGNYTGTKELTFTIAPAKIDTVDLSDSLLIYNGSEQSPEILNVYADGMEVPSSAYEVRGNTGTEAKDYELTVDAVIGGNYTGAVSAPWSILPSDAKTFAVEISPGEFVYDGTEKIPSVTVRDGEKVLAEGSDYTLELLDNTDAGRGLAKVTGIGSYQGIRTVSFTIRKAELTSAELVKNVFVYDGSEKTAEVASVKAGDLTVTDDQYSLSGNTAAGAGGYVLCIRAKDDGNFSGSVTAEWKISEAKIDGLEIILSEDRFVFDGTEKTPDVFVLDGEYLLEEDADYRLDYADNLHAGSGKVIVTGIGNYTGTASKSFTIEKAPIDYAELSDLYLMETGEEQTVDVTLVRAGDLEVPNEAYTVRDNTAVDAGDYEAVITAADDSDYTGSVSVPFTVVKAEALLFEAKLSETKFVYDRTAKQPEVIVTDLAYGTLLTEGTDYSLTYQDNVDAGTAKAVVSGLGRYAGRKILSFTIAKAEIDAAIVKESLLVYSGQKQTVEITSVKAGSLDVPSAAYTLSGQTARDAGSYQLLVKAKEGSSFTGSVMVPYAIVPEDAGIFRAELSESEFIYNGREQKPEVIVKDARTEEILHEGTDYILTYRDNIEAGSATVSVSGRGNYEGTLTQNFTIQKAALSSVLLKESELPYLGTSQTAEVLSVKASQDTLEVPASAYTLSGNTAEQVGTYTLRAAAKDDSSYTGSVTAEYRIVPGDPSLVKVEFTSMDYVYDGTEKKPVLSAVQGRTVLQENVDYRLAYKDNINAGTAAVTIEFLRNYTGTQTYNFTIQKAEIDDVDLTDTILKYTGQTQRVDIVALRSGNLNVPSSEWVITDNTAVEPGNYTLRVSVVSASNFSGSLERVFTILPSGRKDFSAELKKAEFVFDGREKKPEVIAKDGSTVLREGKDYTVSYKDNTHAGTGTAVITGIGSYEGTHELTFRIQKAGITEVSLLQDTLIFNGEIQSPKILEVRSQTMKVPEEQYEVRGNKASEIGEYTLRVTALDGTDFTGSAEVKYRIIQPYESYYFTQKTEKWKRGSGVLAIFTIKRTTRDEMSFGWFRDLEIDGTRISEQSYDKEAGSVILKIHPSLLERMKDGTHILRAVFEDGDISTAFEIVTPSSGGGSEEDEPGPYIPPYSPQNMRRNPVVNTSDRISITKHAWTLLISSAAAMIAFAVLRKNGKRS